MRRASARPAARGAPRCCRTRSAPRPPASRARRPARRDRPRSAGRTISPWLIGMPPSDLREIFAEPDADEQLLDLAEPPGRAACARHRRRAGAPPRHRSQARRARGWRAARGRTVAPTTRPSTRHPLAHLGGGVGQQRLDRAVAARAMGQKVMPGGERRVAAACGILRLQRWCLIVRRTNLSGNGSMLASIDSVQTAKTRARAGKRPNFRDY